jgi:hypothetical protein
VFASSTLPVPILTPFKKRLTPKATKDDDEDGNAAIPVNEKK